MSDFIHDLDNIGCLSAHLVDFFHFLRYQGMKITITEELDAVRALTHIDILDTELFHNVLLTTLAKTLPEQQIFEQMFHVYWQFYVASKGKKRSQNSQSSQKAHSNFPHSLPSLEKNQSKDNTSYSSIEVLYQKNFKATNAKERQQIRSLVEELAKNLASHFSRRYHNASRPGKIHLRKTLRANLCHGGDIIDLCFRKPRVEKSKFVVLCDVSGSMEIYSHFFLQFIYYLQGVYNRIETFVFSTSLLRVTHALRNNDIDHALENISKSFHYWSGGTQIGTCLQHLCDLYGQIFCRNTSFIILSDGWDKGDTQILENSISRIHQHCKLVIWLNPWLGSEGYEPKTRAIQAALPYTDFFAPFHNLQSLRHLVQYLGKNPKRRLS